MLSDVFQHFRKDEQPFIHLVEDWIAKVTRDYAPYTTDFLNPRELFILAAIVGRHDDVSWQVFGGYETAERKVAIIFPNYFEPSNHDFEIQLYDIQYPKKFGTLTHGKILGTLIHTGITRESIGDIITDGDQWQFFIKKNVASFVSNQIEKINNIGVRFHLLSLNDVLQSQEEWLEKTITITSLRIDNMIATVYNISRQRAKMLIESHKVKLNWVVIEKPDLLVEYDDMISVRQFGRFRIKDQLGKTKKERFKIIIHQLQ